MKYLILFISALWLQTALQAQDFDQYTPLASSGKIPADVLTKSSQKYKKEIAKLEKKRSGKTKIKDRKRFALESNFVLDGLLQSGLVLFNDPLTAYLNEVAQKLTVHDKKLANVHIYTLRSTAVNAFATDRGDVYVTLGLLAQLENEAQLAYVLSHELTHVMEKHPLNMFLESKAIDRKSSRQTMLNENSFNEKLLAKNSYSKELEMEADQKGLELFLKTGYSTATLDVVFDVLKYAYLPFDDVKFERSFIDYDGFSTPNELWEKPIKAISGESETHDDTRSTHPNIAARRKALADKLAKTSPKEGTNYLVSEERFKTVQKTARFELPALNLHQGHLADAVYTSYLLLEKSPNSTYLKKCLVKALYYNAKFKNDSDYKYDGVADSLEGESQQVHRLMFNIGAKEMVALALREAWKLHLSIPDDKEINAICDDLFIELAGHAADMSVLKNTLPQANNEEQKQEKAAEDKSKYDKIKEKQNSPETTVADWTYAFVKYADTEEFKKAFEAGQKTHKKRQERKEYYETDKGKKAWRKEVNRNKTKGHKLGIKSIAVVNPFYIKLDARKDNAVQFIPSETGHENLCKLMEEMALKANLKVTLLDVDNLKDNQIDRFNDIRLLNDWCVEQASFEELSITPGIEQEKINAIAKKYNTDYFLWTGVASLREKKKAAFLAVLLGLFIHRCCLMAFMSPQNPSTTCCITPFSST
jgi:hypothetical protein